MQTSQPAHSLPARIVEIPDPLWHVATRLGDGNGSLGIRRLLDVTRKWLLENSVPDLDGEWFKAFSDALTDREDSGEVRPATIEPEHADAASAGTSVSDLLSAAEARKKVLERAIVDLRIELGRLDAPKPESQRATILSDSLIERTDQIESEMIAKALRQFRWNKTKAADHLGIKRTTLQYKIRKYGLE